MNCMGALLLLESKSLGLLLDELQTDKSDDNRDDIQEERDAHAKPELMR